MRIALIANPASGTGDAADAAQLLRAHGAEVDRFPPEEIDAAVSSTPQRVVVAAGDGTIGAAAVAAGRAGIPLAVIPLGTANDFARAVGVPLDPGPAAELAVAGEVTRRLDLGRLGQRPFVNAASAGLSPLAARKARGLKRRFGTLAYVWGALRAGLRAQPVACRVGCEGAEVFAGRAWQVTVGLTGAFGGGADVWADPRDGLLDVVVIGAGSRARLVAHAYGLRAGSVEGQAKVATATCRDVEVELGTGGESGFNVDGELVEARDAHFTVEPAAYEVVVG